MSDRIDFIVIRNPDYETVTETFINGKHVKYPSEWHFDPGAGYTYREYTELGEDIAAADIPKPLKDRLLAIHSDMLSTYRDFGTDSISNWPDE